MSTGSAIFVGMLLPFAAILTGAGIVLLQRWLTRTFLYAKPKYLQRRINLAAEFVDARRAYRLGGKRVWIAVSVGRQWRHDEQARAALMDTFLPVTDPDDARVG